MLRLTTFILNGNFLPDSTISDKLYQNSRKLNDSYWEGKFLCNAKVIALFILIYFNIFITDLKSNNKKQTIF